MRSSRLAAAVVAVATVAFASSAHAEDSSYCKKVHARAAGDAALLFAPSLVAQGIRFPSNGAVDVGATAGSGYQVRGALSWSPLDFYKGFQVMSVSEADCARHGAVISAQELLQAGTDYGKLPALRKQAAFLDARRPAWDAIIQKSDERLAAQVTSLLEANEIRARGADLERRRMQIAGDVQRLEVRGLDDRRAMLSQLAASVEASAMRYEREASHVRSLDAWDVRFTGGLVPSASPVDYYGVVQISFNLGAFTRNANETKYLDARGEELRKARYEVSQQLRVFRDLVRSERDQAKQELSIIDKRAASLVSARAAVAGSDAPNAPHALAVIDLHMILIEADRVFLTAMIDELTRLEDK